MRDCGTESETYQQYNVMHQRNGCFYEESNVVQKRLSEDDILTKMDDLIVKEALATFFLGHGVTQSGWQ